MPRPMSKAVWGSAMSDSLHQAENLPDISVQATRATPFYRQLDAHNFQTTFPMENGEYLTLSEMQRYSVPGLLAFVIVEKGAKVPEFLSEEEVVSVLTDSVSGEQLYVLKPLP